MKQIKVNLLDGYIIMEVSEDIEYFLKNQYTPIIDAFIKACVRQNYFELEEFVSFEFLKENQHFCKYCGEIVDNPETDILCDTCRIDFGHKYYSQL